MDSDHDGLQKKREK